MLVLQAAMVESRTLRLMAKKLNEIMDSVAERMRADFKAASFQHAGETGTAREKIVTDMIAKYLPGHVQAFHSGEIVTADGAVSRQCDVLICDRSAPPLIDMESYRVVPSEAVYGVIEVKSRLDGTELVKACENIKAAKQLAKTAYYPNGPSTQYTRYEKVFEYFPTYGMVFAFDSIDMVTLGNHFAAWCAENEAEHLPDSVWVLGKGYLTFMDETRRPQLSPSGSCDFDLMGMLGKGDVLFPFVLYLNMVFSRARMRPLRLAEYAGTSQLGGRLHSWTGSEPS